MAFNGALFFGNLSVQHHCGNFQYLIAARLRHVYNID
jgi:hypothetical protein